MNEKNIDRLLGLYIAVLLYFGMSAPAYAFFPALFSFFAGLTLTTKILLVVGIVGGFIAAKKAKKRRQRALEQAKASIGGVLVNKAGTAEP